MAEVVRSGVPKSGVPVEGGLPGLPAESKVAAAKGGLPRCPECGSSELLTDLDRGEVVCAQCGLVVREQILATMPEWRAPTPEEKALRQRTGPSTSYSLYDKGLSTVIWVGHDSSGRRLTPGARQRMWALQRWNVRARLRSSESRNLSQAMAELRRLRDVLHIPSDVHENAAMIYRKALRQGLVRGRSIAGMVAASLYAACRTAGTPRTLREIAEASTRTWKEVARDYRLLGRYLSFTTPTDNPEKFVSKIASKAGIDQRTQVEAMRILREAKEKNGVVGKHPLGLAAAALYMASVRMGERKAQRDIASAAGVTEVTIRNRVNGLRQILGVEE
ncbi:MAG: TFIIB-type zinc ribbon-containing protein [Candidatus Bathyarchaeia archaeon]